MDFYGITKRVRKLEFIGNDQRADTAVKAVLGILASRMSDEHASKLATKFPEHIAAERFGSYHNKMEAISVTQYTAGISSEFKISVHQARTLMRNVLYFTKEAAGVDVIMDIKKSLPIDWAEAIQNA